MGAPPLFRRILCAVDFSPASLVALAQARTIAEQCADGHLVVLHVVEGFPHEPVYSAGRAAQLIGQLEGRIGELNRRLRALVPADPADERVEYVTVSGPPSRAIVAAAAEHAADLVVLGASQRARLDHMVSGSTVKAVVRNAHCAVLVALRPARD
jgi:nucleotide-binding universal stress UspA family protein